MSSRQIFLPILLAIVLVLGAVAYFLGWFPGGNRASFIAHQWTDAELAVIGSLAIDSLPPLPPDPSNAVGDDPQAVELGHALYFDARLSPDGAVACATCHQPEKYFTDGKPRANVQGVDTPRHTPTIVGLGYSAWFYWDGRKDSQWSQALAPQEAAIEHGGNRSLHAHVIAEHYRELYEAVFGPMPDISDPARFPRNAGPVDDPEARAAWDAMDPADQVVINRIFANIGKAIAAYERRILPGRSRFDAYAAAALAGDQARMAELFTPEEAAGLRLFIGDAQCTNCHNGPLFTNGTFHNIGLPLLEGAEIDPGRAQGVLQVLEDEFNCLGPYSDAKPEDCAELRFVKREGEELIGAFKAPSLRNVANTAPYMHDGRFADLDAVLAHYNAAPPAFPGHTDLQPLAFPQEKLNQVKAFLMTLSAPATVPGGLLEPPPD